MNCPKCGFDAGESKFCPECGTKIESSSFSDTIDETPVTNVDSVNDNIAENNDVVSEKVPTKSKIQLDSKLIKKIVIAVVAIILLIVIGKGVSKAITNGKLMSKYNGYMTDLNYSSATKLISSNYSNKNFLKKAEKKAFKAYEDYIDDNDFENAAKIYNEFLVNSYCFDQVSIADLEEDILDDIEEMEKDFESGENKFADIKAVLTGYKGYENDDIKNAATELYDKSEKAYNSEKGFKDGNSYYEKNDYENAIASFSKVSSDDKNYDEAQSKIAEMKDSYKKETLDSVEKLIKNNKYDDALKLLNQFNKLCSDDDVDSKIREVEKLQTVYEGKKAKEEQIIEVTSVKVFKGNSYINDKSVSVVIKNNSDKVIKDGTVVVAAFDKNGYPVNIRYSMYADQYGHMQKCRFETANIMPGSSWGNNKYWDDLDYNTTKARAIVKQVDFTDGTSWYNPYYDYWVEIYANSYD